jgi:hypothetical protein
LLTKNVLKHFGGPKKISEALTKDGWEITSMAISQWKDEPPKGRQYQIERITKKKLIVKG